MGQDATLSHIYWTDRNTHKIQRANLDGSNVETLVTLGEDVFAGPYGLALDVDGGKIYWTDDKRNSRIERIRRANLDGSNIETIIFSRIRPSSLALDVDGGKIYWTDQNNIRRANLDGSNIETLITEWSWSPRSPELALDADRGKIYWIAYDIRRANLDGSNIETLITEDELDYDPHDSIATGLTGLALDVDESKMYWTDSVGRLRWANLDGSNIETLLYGLSNPFNPILDRDRGKIYWVNNTWSAIHIWRVNLDGSNFETFITGLDASASSVFALGPYHELANPEEIQTRSREEARSELAERGIPYNQRSFVTYAQNGDLDLVRLFVEAGLDVNVQPYSSSTVLIPRQEHVEQLNDLEAVWFPQDGDEDNDTALMKAAGQGHIEVVRFLVEQGADPQCHSTLRGKAP